MLLETRKYTTYISRTKSIVEVSKKSSHAKLQCRREILETYFKQAHSGRADIEDLDPSDTAKFCI